MAESKYSGSQNLTFEQANAAFRAFVPIGDQIYEYLSALREAGFSAFDPYLEFNESYATSEEELATHRKCILETAKNRIARPWPMRFSPDEIRQIYRSPYVQDLAAKRDAENGIPVEQLSDQYGLEMLWRKEFDPCLRHMQKFSVDNPEAHNKRWENVHLTSSNQLAKEAAQLRSDIAHNFPLAAFRRTKFFKTVMEQEAVPLGFVLDRAKSKTNYPVFSKAIGAHWDVCWSLEDPKQLDWSPREGRFDPTLHIRTKELRGRIRGADPGDALYIEYRRVVPGFFQGYRIFKNSAELETIIKAHLLLYDFMAPIIEPGLKSVLDP